MEEDAVCVEGARESRVGRVKEGVRMRLGEEEEERSVNDGNDKKNTFSKNIISAVYANSNPVT